MLALRVLGLRRSQCPFSFSASASPPPPPQGLGFEEGRASSPELRSLPRLFLSSPKVVIIGLPLREDDPNGSIIRSLPSKPDALRALGLAVSANLGISSDNLSKWYSVTPTQVLRFGGTDLSKDYAAIVPSLARAAFPEHNWIDSKFVHGVPVADRVRLRKSLRGIANKLGFDGTNLENWYRVSTRKIGHLYKKFGSRLRLLQTAYPDHEWDSKQFTRKSGFHWKSMENQRFAVERLGEKLGIKEGDFEAWYKVKGLLRLIPSAESLKIKNRYQFLSTVVPEHKWSRHRFLFSRLDFMSASDEVVTQFAKDLEEELGLTSPEAWYNVTKQDLVKLGCATSFRAQAHLLLLLQVAYPFVDWEPGRFRFAALGFGYLFSNVVKLFRRGFSRAPAKLQNRHYDQALVVPEYKILFNYQGPMFYAKQLLEKPDFIKREGSFEVAEWCKENDHTLINVPFWCERDLKHLLAELWSLRPDLFTKWGPLGAYEEIASTSPRMPSSISTRELSLNKTHLRAWQRDERFARVGLTPKKSRSKASVVSKVKS